MGKFVEEQQGYFKEESVDVGREKWSGGDEGALWDGGRTEEGGVGEAEREGQRRRGREMRAELRSGKHTNGHILTRGDALCVCT